MLEIDRRTFLKQVVASGVGVTVGEFTFPVKRRLNEAVQKVTGQPTGNASLKQRVEEACMGSDDPRKCVRDYQFPPEEKVEFVVIAPVVEEAMFRLVPSFFVDCVEPRKEGNLGLTRREFFVGIVSSALFGMVHNLTDKGFDTKIIPASQTAGGVVYWYLQRKFGFVANTLAHAWNNFRCLT